MRPPNVSILFPKRFPNLLPAKTPSNDNKNVTIPITIIGIAIYILRNAKLNPTANASMLVATDNINKT